MAQALAAVEENLTLTQEILIQVESDFTFAVDQTYISIDQNTIATIRFRIQAPDLPPGCAVRFDRPAITFAGEEGNGLVTSADPDQVTMTWINDEDHAGRSFFYRIHMVGSRPAFGGGTEKFTLSHDPTIHNDPPS